MPKRKIIIFAVSVSVILVISCALSYLYGFRQGMRSGNLTAEMAEVWLYSDYYAEQLHNANCEGAKNAINDHLSMIEKYKDSEGSLISGTTYLMDKMLDHTRLSIIENHLGNRQSSDKHMKIALESCNGLNRKECTKETLLSFQQRIDEKNSIACLSSDN